MSNRDRTISKCESYNEAEWTWQRAAYGIDGRTDGPIQAFNKLNTLCTYRFLLFFAKQAIYLSIRSECVTHSGRNIIQY